MQRIQVYSIEEYDQLIEQLYKQNSSAHNDAEKIAEQIDFFSKKFLSKPYLLGALGEGLQGRFDQSPLYRFDAFDCVTYVNTILALSLASNLQQFKLILIKIAYHGEPVFQQRNHFISGDWNRNNAEQGLINDMTMQIVDEKNNSIARQASTVIDRPNWFRHRSYQDIKLLKAIDKHQSKQLLHELHACASLVEKETVQTSYMPLNVLFDSKGATNYFLLNQIPHGAIIEIVRPNWDLRDKIGTHLNISHMGFAIVKENNLYFRHASSQHQCVEEVLLTDYLKQFISSETIKGINVQKVLNTAYS